MAWITGLVSDEELDTLRKLGWEDTDPPAEMLSEDELRGVAHVQTRAFFVDNDLYAIMTGPDWEQPNAGLSGGEAVRSDALLGHCVKCGERLSGHEDENRTHCRWCVTGWTPEDANTGQEAQVNERPNAGGDAHGNRQEND